MRSVTEEVQVCVTAAFSRKNRTGFGILRTCLAWPLDTDRNIALGLSIATELAVHSPPARTRLTRT